MPRNPKPITIHLRLRIRVDLLHRFKEAAEKNHRPVSSEIMRRLETSLTIDTIADAIERTAQATRDAVIEERSHLWNRARVLSRLLLEGITAADKAEIEQWRRQSIEMLAADPTGYGLDEPIPGASSPQMAKSK